MSQRSTIVDLAKSWLGMNEADGSHQKIIDIYNSQNPLPRKYKVTYKDAWCATTVSALAVKLGYTNIIPTECSCIKMIERMKELGIWIEDDAYVPAPGDIIFYDWQDSGSGDCVGAADHVGIVETCDGKQISVIEGNKNDSVSRRKIAVNAKYIRGYGVPKYDAGNAPAFQEPSTTVKYNGIVTASSLNVRQGPGTSHALSNYWPILNKGDVVNVCDEYDGWCYIRLTRTHGDHYCRTMHYAWASSKYIKRG